jgi:uncharacterized membrane protein
MIGFDRPEFLLLVPAVALVWGMRRFSLARWDARQALVCTGLRSVLVLLVILALAGPRLAGTSSDPAVVFLRDRSASIPAVAEEAAAAWLTAARPPAGRSTVVDFAAEARIGGTAMPPGEARETNLSRALEFAGAILPPDRPGRVILFSDGRATAGGDPRAAAASLAAAGVEIDVVPVADDPRPDAAVSGILVPPGVRDREVFDLTAVVDASVGLSGAVVRVYQNNVLAQEKSLDLAAGETRVDFPGLRADGRLGLYEVEVAAAGDVRPENDRLQSAVPHEGAPSVLLVDARPEQSEPLAAALRAEGLPVTLVPPPGFPRTLAELENFDLVIFADAPAAAFGDDQLTMLSDWVRDFGGGFLMIGGEESFGAGGYFRTPLAALLPVAMEREEREETPVAALLVILDRSGSMAAAAGAQTKMALANEGAVMALDVLQSRDSFGLFAVDTRVQDVVPLAPVGDREASARRIAAITAGGGGIYIYTALAEALPRLRDVEARVKHIILFSDAADAEEKTSEQPGQGAVPGGSALDLAAAMLAGRITLSVVALGSEEDRDTDFLRQLAGQGGGRFYLTADATTLPRLFTLETMRATESSLREEAFLAVPAAETAATRGVDWASVPLLLGFNVTRAKPGATVEVVTEGKDPLLATWRFGLGRVGAFASDAKARWASEWLGWPGFGKFWVQLVRSLLRPATRGDWAVSLREADGKLVVEADAIAADGTFRNALKPVAVLALPDREPVEFPLRQTAPGRYRAEVPRPAGERASLAVSDGEGRPVTLAWSASYPDEFRHRPPDTAALRELVAASGGRWDPAPADAFRPARQPRDTRRDLAPWCLALAALLWPVDVWLRRRRWAAGNR